MNDDKPGEAVGCCYHKIWGDERPSTGVGASEVQAGLPGPLTQLCFNAPYDPGGGLWPPAV